MLLSSQTPPPAARPRAAPPTAPTRPLPGPGPRAPYPRPWPACGGAWSLQYVKGPVGPLLCPPPEPVNLQATIHVNPQSPGRLAIPACFLPLLPAHAFATFGQWRVLNLTDVSNQEGMQFLSRSTIRYKALRDSDGCIQVSGCPQFSPRWVQAAITKCRKQRDLERTENLFLTILKAGKSKTRDGQIHGDFPLCPHMPQPKPDWLVPATPATMCPVTIIVPF
uniref:Uncharacterized protein n=1 Tax=Rangifer tarandus platyrhynchus TaxID=3082113 RepID=A0ACB0EMT5_RANTA|nr:unnamed protein product [Rangifer tarandus platyrhynchus]